MSSVRLLRSLFFGPRVTEPAASLLRPGEASTGPAGAALSGPTGAAPRAAALPGSPGDGAPPDAREPDDLDWAGAQLRTIIDRLYGGRSLRIRAVDAGSSNAEEIELTALGNAYYDIERFGLSFVASPRHADILMVTGPVVRNLAGALRATYEAAPHPCVVVAVGDGACTGGIWRGSYAVVGAVDEVIPVHVRIWGDPPSPADIIRGLADGLRRTR